MAGDRWASPTGRPNDERSRLTRGKTRRDLALPGLTVLIVPGAGARIEPPVPDSRFGALYLASDPRRFLENLTRGRGWNNRVLPQEALEAALDRILMVGGPKRLNQLRDAREIALSLNCDAQFKRLDGLIGALLGTHESKYLTAKQALARAAGRPYDCFLGTEGGGVFELGFGVGAQRRSGKALSA